MPCLQIQIKDPPKLEARPNYERIKAWLKERVFSIKGEQREELNKYAQRTIVWGKFDPSINPITSVALLEAMGCEVEEKGNTESILNGSKKERRKYIEQLTRYHELDFLLKFAPPAMREHHKPNGMRGFNQSHEKQKTCAENAYGMYDDLPFITPELRTMCQANGEMRASNTIKACMCTIAELQANEAADAIIMQAIHAGGLSPQISMKAMVK